MNDRTLAAVHAAGRDDALRQQAMEIGAKAWVEAILADDPDPQARYEAAFDEAMGKNRANEEEP